MKMYRRLTHSVNDSGKLIDSREDVAKHVDTASDWYLSVYKYNERHFQEFQEKNTISGITDVTTDKLVFDFDSEAEPALAKDSAFQLCQKLLDHGIPEGDIPNLLLRKQRLWN